MVDLVTHQAHFRLLLKQVPQAFVEVPVNCLHSLQRPPGLGPDHPQQIAALIRVVVLFQAFDSDCETLVVGGGTVVFEVEFDFLDGLCQHELMLVELEGGTLQETLKALVNLNYFLEIEFFEVNVEPAH